MPEITQILSAIEAGDPKAAEQLLPLVYDELRKLAAAKLAQEKPGQTLEATALVHEAYIRLVASENTASGAASARRDVGNTSSSRLDAPQHWNSRGHFFAAAAEAMRRILVDSARQKQTLKHGGNRLRVPLDELTVPGKPTNFDLLEIDELIGQLAAVNPKAAELVKLRFFAGMTGEEAAHVLGMSPRAVDLLWAYARAWLFEKLQQSRA